jgi:hypothetical protein
MNRTKRDILNNLDYFENSIKERTSSIIKFIQWIENGRVSNERLNTVKQEIGKIYLYKSITKYSAGYGIHELKNDLLQSIKYVYKSWNGFWKLKNSKGKVLNQYILSAYDEMIWTLSLALLLRIDNSEFKNLVEVIDRDNIKDELFEFIIKGKISSRISSSEESYEEYFTITTIFEKLRLAIKSESKREAELLIKDFLEKDWYKKHKDAGWHNSHKSKNNIYFGYWSFESAAITCLMDLDDSDYQGNEFYPRALVDYYRKTSSK